MSVFKFPILISLLFSCCVFACTNANIDELIPDNPPGGACDSSYAYSGAISAIIETNCALPTCHVPGGDGTGIFTDYVGVKAKVDDGSFENQVLILKDMPPSNSPGPKALSDCDLKKITKWLNDGAPE